MRPNRRQFLLAAASAASIATSQPAFAQRGTSLSVLYSNPNLFKGPMEEISRRFEQRHPNVTIKLTALKNYTEMLQLMLRTAITGDAPDIGFQGLSFVHILSERQIAIPLDAFMEQEANWASLGYSKSVMSLATDSGKTIGIP